MSLQFYEVGFTMTNVGLIPHLGIKIPFSIHDGLYSEQKSVKSESKHLESKFN